MRYLSFVVLIALAATPGALRAEQKFDAAGRANIVAPYLDDQTFAVAHVDVSRIAADPLFAMLMDWLPDAKEELQQQKAEVLANLGGFLRAGGKDIYWVMSTEDIALGMEAQPFFVVVPLPKGADPKVLSEWMRVLSYDTIQRRGDVLLAGSRGTIERLNTLKPVTRPEVARAYDAAGDTAAQFLFVPPDYWRRVVEEMMPTLPDLVGGGPSSIVTNGVRWLAIGVDPPTRFSFRLIVQSRDKEAAVALQRKWGEIYQAIGRRKEVRQSLPQFDQLVALLTPTVDGDRLTLTIDAAKGLAAAVAFLRPALVNAREEAHRTQEMNSFKQIGLAMHRYLDAHNSFPPAASCDKQGKPLLSWRVHLLPYLEQDALYKQFHLDEAWDSPHNRTLIEKMPNVYRPTASKAAKGRTNYVVPVAAETMFPPGGKGITIKEVSDGLSNTIMGVEVDDDHAVVWTKPDDWDVDFNDLLKGFGGLHGGRTIALFADGSVRLLRANIDAKTLRALLTPAGGEMIDSDKY